MNSLVEEEADSSSIGCLGKKLWAALSLKSALSLFAAPQFRSAKLFRCAFSALFTYSSFIA
jgi:hypothetical protein